MALDVADDLFEADETGDMAVAMDGLLKTQPGSQLFTVFSAPRVKGSMRRKDGEQVVEVEGMDVYDPVSNMLYPTDRQRIAANEGLRVLTPPMARHVRCS